MTDDTKTEQAEQPEQAQPEQAQPQEDGRPQVTTIVRTLIVQTDGNKVMVVKNEMGLLELARALQMLSTQVEQEISNAARVVPKAAPKPATESSPEVTPDKAEEEQ